jgi:hypothetical protein
MGVKGTQRDLNGRRPPSSHGGHVQPRSRRPFSRFSPQAPRFLDTRNAAHFCFEKPYVFMNHLMLSSKCEALGRLDDLSVGLSHIDNEPGSCRL